MNQDIMLTDNEIDINNIFGVYPNKVGGFTLMENCDNYFYLEITANELEMIARKMLDMVENIGK